MLDLHGAALKDMKAFPTLRFEADLTFHKSFLSTRPRLSGFKKNVEAVLDNHLRTKHSSGGLYKDLLQAKQIARPALTLYKNRSTCNYNVCGLQISLKGNTMTNSYLLLRTKKLSV